VLGILIKTHVLRLLRRVLCAPHLDSEMGEKMNLNPPPFLPDRGGIQCVHEVE